MIKISDAEMEVMKVVWEKKEVTSTEIIRELEYCEWTDNTVRTLINRLIAKKAVGISKKEGKVYTYVPLIKENEYKMKKAKSVVKQLYHGSVNEMLLNFIDFDEISKKDLEFLIDKVDERKKRRGKK